MALIMKFSTRYDVMIDDKTLNLHLFYAKYFLYIGNVFSKIHIATWKIYAFHGPCVYRSSTMESDDGKDRF